MSLDTSVSLEEDLSNASGVSKYDASLNSELESDSDIILGPLDSKVKSLESDDVTVDDDILGDVSTTMTSMTLVTEAEKVKVK